MRIGFKTANGQFFSFYRHSNLFGLSWSMRCLDYDDAWVVNSVTYTDGRIFPGSYYAYPWQKPAEK